MPPILPALAQRRGDTDFGALYGYSIRRVAVWRIVHERGFEGPGEANADVEGGQSFTLEHAETAEERHLSVEVAAGGRGVPTSRLREVARQYLDEPDPPRRVIVDRDGRVIRTVEP
jgi:hypothetical protein